jgi:mono/diheme cytochrome c family protein
MSARIFTSLAIMVCLVTSMAAWSGKAVADEQAFMEHCGQCHARAASLAGSLKGSTAEERTATLANFLETHHTKDAKARTVVIDYLVGLSAQ